MTVNGILTAGDGPTLTGTLAVGSLSFGATGAFNLGVTGTTAGTGFDQITSAGSVNLTGAALNLSVLPGLPAAIGTVFDVLVNNSGSAITGTFTGAAEGATVANSGVAFKVSYVGGASGHDFTLTSLAPTIYYADTAWTGLANGSVINDADPVTPGNQTHTIGTNAFASVNAAITAVPVDWNRGGQRPLPPAAVPATSPRTCSSTSKSP